MAKRNKLEIMRDILEIVRDNKEIKPTPLLRQSNVSSSRFKEYFGEMKKRGLLREGLGRRDERLVILTERGFKFLEKYKTIVNFIEEFEL